MTTIGVANATRAAIIYKTPPLKVFDLTDKVKEDDEFEDVKKWRNLVITSKGTSYGNNLYLSFEEASQRGNEFFKKCRNAPNTSVFCIDDCVLYNTAKTITQYDIFALEMYFKRKFVIPSVQVSGVLQVPII